jgi:hypothetical protein
MLTFEKNFIEFHREFYFWERFEKRVFPTDPLSRTDTFGTHCMSNSFESNSNPIIIEIWCFFGIKIRFNNKKVPQKK